MASPTAADSTSGAALAIVVDCGSSSFKAGFSSHARPTVSLEVQEDLALSAATWRELLEKRLGANVSAHPLLVAVPVSASVQAREALCQLLFETFQAPSIFIGSTAFLAALGGGLGTALVVDVGESGTSAVLVDEGYPLVHCSQRSAVGGSFISAKMEQLMREAGLHLKENEWAAAVRLAKEQLGTLAADSEELQKMLAGDYTAESCTLPNGKLFSAMRAEGFQCAEHLFAPRCDKASMEPTISLQELVIRSLRLLSDINMRGKMLEKILVVGGGSMIQGFQDRLLHEVKKLSPWVAPGTKLDSIQVVAPMDRDVLAWQGAAHLAECDILRSLLITREDFKDYGAAGIHRNFM